MYGFRKSLIGFFNHYRKIPQSRLLEIEVFRGIAVLCIILHHYFGLYHLLHGHHFSTPDPATLAIIFNWGVYGVHLFFIISGFVIFTTV